MPGTSKDTAGDVSVGAVGQKGGKQGRETPASPSHPKTASTLEGNRSPKKGSTQVPKWEERRVGMSPR